MRALLIVALLSLSLTACGEPADCRRADMTTYGTSISEQITAFQQQATLTGSTPRMSMGVPLQRLLDIQTETRKIAPPGCLAKYHETLLAAMEIQQMGYQNFASQQMDADMSASFINIGGAALNEREQELVLILGGTVPPTPTPRP